MLVELSELSTSTSTSHEIYYFWAMYFYGLSCSRPLVTDVVLFRFCLQCESGEIWWVCLYQMSSAQKVYILLIMWRKNNKLSIMRRICSYFFFSNLL